MVIPENTVADNRARLEVAHAAAGGHIVFLDVGWSQVHPGLIGRISIADDEPVEDGTVGAFQYLHGIFCLIAVADISAEDGRMVYPIAPVGVGLVSGKTSIKRHIGFEIEGDGSVGRIGIIGPLRHPYLISLSGHGQRALQRSERRLPAQPS
ncbi:MAG: hypothetical protein AB7F40_07770 [Victivallaceae bacterium]|nr:hypothetical protein [Victivallaceae bacterium]